MTRPTVAALQAQIGQMVIDHNEQCNKYHDDVLAARADVKRLQSERDSALDQFGRERNEAMQQREECCKLRGMIEMLERLGTIPRVKPEICQHFNASGAIDPAYIRDAMRRGVL